MNQTPELTEMIKEEVAMLTEMVDKIDRRRGPNLGPALSEFRADLDARIKRLEACLE